MSNIFSNFFDSCIKKIPKDNNALDNRNLFPSYYRINSNDEFIQFPTQNDIEDRYFSNSTNADFFKAISVLVRHKGLDVIAFYKSKRFEDLEPFRGKWGIFYMEQGLAWMCQQINQCFPSRYENLSIALGF
ncbi:MAG: hypothetical protein ACKO26_26955, partial [Planctomycetota bacterium]